MCIGPVGLAETYSTMIFFFLPQSLRPYSGPCSQNFLYNVDIEPLAEKEIQKSGARNFAPVEVGAAQVEVFLNDFGNFARSRMETPSR